VTLTGIASSSSRRADGDAGAAQRRTAVIDLGSNSFRLVVFTAVPRSWWKRTDEIHEAVRIGAGLDETGRLGEGPVERALRTVDLYAHFLRAVDIPPGDTRAVATSAIRDARNGPEFVARAESATGLTVQVLTPEEEAHYGFLAAVNSTTLAAGVALDIGGGSVQLVEVSDRRERHAGSWRLGAVRMTEHFLPGETASKKQLKALRDHVRTTLADVDWLASAGRHLVGLGGTVRNLAAAAQRRADLPSFGVQDFVLRDEALDDLIALLADLPAGERGSVPGIKPQRGDLILAGAVVVRAIMDVGGFSELEVTEAGLREGIFLERHLARDDGEPPVLDDVRGASVRNLAAQYGHDGPHDRHVAHLALGLFDDLAAAGLHDGDADERELLWAAAMLHDIGVTIDYDDHHKHSRYLILSAGLPGFNPREVAIVAQMARYHRKGTPSFDDLKALVTDDDQAILDRGAALLRIAESLDRSRDQIVEATRAKLDRDGDVTLRLVAHEDASVARWVAAPRRPVRAGLRAPPARRRLEPAGGGRDVLVEAHDATVVDGEHVHEPVARLRPVELAGGAADGDDLLTGVGDLVDLDAEVGPQRADAAEELADLLGAVRVAAVGHAVGNGPLDVLGEKAEDGGDVAAAECGVGAVDDGAGGLAHADLPPGGGCLR
jgi:exopolyphosphatase/guanosine-5'-triphosphate,3'-diphosphate pyrophosphatase